MVSYVDKMGNLDEGDLSQPMNAPDGGDCFYIGIITDVEAEEYEVSPLGVHLCEVVSGPLGRERRPIAKFTSEDEALNFLTVMRARFGAIAPTDG